MLAVEPMINITIEKSVIEKLLDKDTITKADIQSLELFNEHHIDKLLAAGQMTARYKVAEALTRRGIEEVR